ncbi:MAG: hypothetical protein IJV31_01720 [Clostridia bacterium]|nr:hypothetical protein [Clostridia bacterium]
MDREYNIECLDKYDFSEFMYNGRDFWNLLDMIEEKYDTEFKAMYGIYCFDYLCDEEIMDYFKSRYNVQFQGYVSWVCRPMEYKVTKNDINRL